MSIKRKEHFIQLTEFFAGMSIVFCFAMEIFIKPISDLFCVGTGVTAILSLLFLIIAKFSKETDSD